MKRSLFFNLILATALVFGGTVGCKRKPKSPTPIPTRPSGATGPGTYGAQDPGYTSGGEVIVPPPGPIETAQPGPGPVNGNSNVPYDLKDSMEGWKADSGFFADYKVYFDFDRSAVRAGERAKVESVGQHLLANPMHGVSIEGHCDERGTEGYNLALGERRALAVREYLVTMGVMANRVETVSYGESRPAAIGNTKEAYAQNRRGEFTLLTPP